MIWKRILIKKDRDTQSNLVLFRNSGQSKINFIQSHIFPIVDSYFVTLFYILKFINNKAIDNKSFLENV